MLPKICVVILMTGSLFCAAEQTQSDTIVRSLFELHSPAYDAQLLKLAVDNNDYSKLDEFLKKNPIYVCALNLITHADAVLAASDRDQIKQVIQNLDDARAFSAHTLSACLKLFKIDDGLTFDPVQRRFLAFSLCLRLYKYLYADLSLLRIMQPAIFLITSDLSIENLLALSISAYETVQCAKIAHTVYRFFQTFRKVLNPVVQDSKKMLQLKERCLTVLERLDQSH